MAKKPGAAKRPKPATVWVATYLCSSRGCGAQEHTLCIEQAERPADDEMLTYRCPVTRKPTGFRFGDLGWKQVDAVPNSAIVIRPRAR